MLGSNNSNSNNNSNSISHGEYNLYGMGDALEDPSFSSVLSQIFEQSQLEILSSNNTNNNNPFDLVPSSLAPSLEPLLDETQHYEPLLDPALNYISQILAEEEDYSSGHPCMSIEEFLAWQQKTEEMAALLREDSPLLPSFLFPAPASSCDDSLQLSATASGSGSFSSSSDQDFVSSAENRAVVASDDIGLRSSDLHRKAPKASAVTSRVLKARKEGGGMSRKKGGKSGRSNRDGTEQELVDLNDLLLQVSQAVGVNNLKSAMEILKRIKRHGSPHGNGSQRLAYYFMEALDARFSGTGWPLYLGLLSRRPSAVEVLRATGVYMDKCPFIKVAHYFINQTILNAAKGATRLYIMELQMSSGLHYPSLFRALAERPGGPPLVIMTGIGFPHYSVTANHIQTILEGVQKTGRQLSEYAAICGIPFQFNAWAGNRENLQMADFVPAERDANEVFVIISAHLLRYVMDDLDSPDARQKLLNMGRSLKPDVYIQGVVTGAYNTPFFTRRFREALFYFESLYDVLDTFIERENPDRIILESEILGKAILNIVACEGTEIIERIDKYKHWQQVTEEAGFSQRVLNREIKDNVQTMLRSWHKEYNVGEDSHYMLLGWKGRMLYAMSTWNVPQSQ